MKVWKQEHDEREKEKGGGCMRTRVLPDLSTRHMLRYQALKIVREILSIESPLDEGRRERRTGTQIQRDPGRKIDVDNLPLKQHTEWYSHTNRHTRRPQYIAMKTRED